MPEFFELLVQQQEQYRPRHHRQAGRQDDAGQHRRVPGEAPEGSGPHRGLIARDRNGPCAAPGARPSLSGRASKIRSDDDRYRYARPRARRASSSCGSTTGRSALVLADRHLDRWRSRCCRPKSSLLGCARGLRARRRVGRLQCLGPLQGRPAGRAGDRAAVRDEHLSAAVVARPVASSPTAPTGRRRRLRRPRQLREDPDRSRRLGAPADHRDDRRSSPCRCRWSSASCWPCCSPSSSRCAAICSSWC